MTRHLLVLALIAGPLAAHAGTSALTLNHHGFLLNTEDEAVDGTIRLVVKIWTDATSQQEAAVAWTDTWEALPISRGRYSVLLGDVSTNHKALPASVFTSDVWLGLSFGTGPELAPRLPLPPVPLATRAVTADRALDADRLGGKTLSDLDARFAPASGGGYAQVQADGAIAAQAGNVAVTGVVSAGRFAGGGSDLTGLPAGQLTGTLPGAALAGTYSGAVALDNTANTFKGSFDGAHTGSFDGAHTGTFAGAVSGTFAGRLQKGPAGAAPTCNADAAASVYFATDSQALLACDGTVWRIVGARPASLRWSQLSLDLDLIASQQQQLVNLRNDGDVAATGLAFNLTGGFLQTNDCGGSIAAGASCTVTLSLPTSGSSVRRTGTATATAAGGVTSQPVALAGTYTPASCKQAKVDQPGAGSGLYMVDADGLFGRPPFQVYCDMVTDVANGAWTILIKHPVEATTQDPFADYGTLTNGPDGGAYSMWSRRTLFTYDEVLYRPTFDPKMYARVKGRTLNWVLPDGSAGSRVASTDVSLSTGSVVHSGYYGLALVEFPPSGWCTHTGYIFGLPGGDPHGCHYDAWYWTWGAVSSGNTPVAAPIAAQYKAGRALIGIR